MGIMGPMMTRTWVRLAREVLGEDPRHDRGIGHRDDTCPPNTGASVNMMDLQPALWEEPDTDVYNKTLTVSDVMGV